MTRLTAAAAKSPMPGMRPRTESAPSDTRVPGMRSAVSISRASPPHVDKVVAAVHTDEKGTELSVRLGIAADDDLVPGPAFRLRPGVGAAGLVWCLRLLRDDAFKGELARRSKHGVAAGFEMLHITQACIVGGLDQQLLQPRFPIGQWLRPQILAAIKQQVEREIDQTSGVAFRQRGLKRRKVGRAVVVESANLAVDDAVR